MKLQFNFKYFASPMSILRETDNFEISYFRVTKFALSFLNQWPGYKNSSRKTIAYIAFNMITQFLVIFGSLKYSNEMFQEDLGLSLRALCPCITISISFMKLIYLNVYHEKFAALIFDLKDCLKLDMKCCDKSKMIAKFTRISLKYTLLLLIFSNITNFFFGLAPIMNYYGSKLFSATNSTGPIMELQLPFPLSIPFVKYDANHHTIIFKICYIVPLLAGNTTVLGFTGIDGGFMCCCLYLSAARNAVYLDFQKAYKKYDSVDVLSPAQNRNWSISLRMLLHRQSILMEMSKRLSEWYAPIIVIHFFFAALSIGISLMLLISLAQGFEKAIYIFYAISVSTQLFIYCSGAEYLNENTLKFAEICYDCPWYKSDKRIRKLLVLCMIGSQRGCKLQVPFFNPSLQVFQAIMRTAGSYITLLQTFV